MSEALSMGGAVVKGVAGYQAGKYNRAAARSEATSIERDGAAEEARIRDAARMAMGQQIAGQAENGFQIGTGSALDALNQSAINAALDAMTARRTASAKARAARASGEVAYAAGKNALVGELIGAGRTAVDWASDRRAATGGAG